MSRIIKLCEVIQLTSMSRSSIYRAMAEDNFPLPIKLTSRSIGWPLASVEDWIANRPAGIAPCADNRQYQTEAYLTSRPGADRDAATS